jgi:hypothetical protein
MAMHRVQWSTEPWTRQVTKKYSLYNTYMWELNLKLIYDIHIQCDDTHTTKENTEALINASREVDSQPEDSHVWDAAESSFHKLR